MSNSPTGLQDLKVGELTRMRAALERMCAPPQFDHTTDHSNETIVRGLAFQAGRHSVWEAIDRAIANKKRGDDNELSEPAWREAPDSDDAE
jgi:hypothetical protein